MKIKKLDTSPDFGKPGVTKDRAAGQQPSMPFPFSLDALAIFAVFLQITELYRPLGYLANFQNSLQVNLAFVAFFMFYLVVRNETFLRLHLRILAVWSVALIGVPVAVMSTHLLDGITTTARLTYWALFSLHFLFLLLACAVLWGRWGPSLSFPFFIACITATWFGFFINWTNYEFLRKVMAFGSIPIAASISTDRAIGFYQHPNVAAFSLTLYFATLASTPRFLKSSLLVQILVSMACLLGVVLAGSRTSLLLLALASVWHVYNLSRIGNTGRISPRRREVIAPLVPVAVILFSIVLVRLIASTRDDISAMLSARAASTVELLAGGSDESVDLRVSILSRYFSDITRAPLFGNGPDFATTQIKVGAYSNSSQNAWLEWAVKFGLPYTILMASVLFITYRFAKKCAGRNRLALSYARLMLTLLFIITFSMVDIFWIRSSVCSLGVLLGVLAFVREDNHRASQTDPALSTSIGGG